MSTLHVKPLLAPETWVRGRFFFGGGGGGGWVDNVRSYDDHAPCEPHEHSESCTTPFPNSKVALARFAPSCMPRNRLRVMSQHCLRGKGGL